MGSIEEWLSSMLLLLLTCLISISQCSDLHNKITDFEHDLLEHVKEYLENVPEIPIEKENDLDDEDDDDLNDDDEYFDKDDVIKKEDETDNWKKRLHKRSFGTFVTQNKRRHNLMQIADEEEEPQITRPLKRNKNGGIKHLLALCKQAPDSANDNKPLKKKLKSKNSLAILRSFSTAPMWSRKKQKRSLPSVRSKRSVRSKPSVASIRFKRSFRSNRSVRSKPSLASVRPKRSVRHRRGGRPGETEKLKAELLRCLNRKGLIGQRNPTPRNKKQRNFIRFGK